MPYYMLNVEIKGRLPGCGQAHVIVRPLADVALHNGSLFVRAALPPGHRRAPVATCSVHSTHRNAGGAPRGPGGV